MDRIIGGWELTGIWTFQSGLPLTFGSDFFFQGDPSTIVLPVDERTPERWFNTFAFVTAASAQPVSHLRVNPLRFSWMRGPRQNNDLSLLKDTRITENKLLRLNIQALNAFNHPLFPAPQMGLTNANFGQIVPSTQNNYPRRLQFEQKFLF